MKFLRQFAIILFVSFLGEILHILIPLPVPASVYGLLLMFTALCTGILKQEQVREAADFLIEIMPVMFIPAAVGLIDSWQTIREAWVSYVVITAVSTVAVMAVSGRAVQAVMKRSKKKEEAG